MPGYIPQTILWHLLHTGPARAATLGRVMGLRRDPVGRVLRRMRACGQVAERPNCPGVWELTVKGIGAARAVDVSEIEQAVAPAPEPAAVVQAPCFDRIRAPAYVPDAGPAMRPGALDYKRVATVGLRC